MGFLYIGGIKGIFVKPEVINKTSRPVSRKGCGVAQV